MRMFIPAFCDGPYMYGVSRLDNCYLIRAEMLVGEDKMSDDALVSLIGMRSADDLVCQEPPTPHDEVWEMLRAIKGTKAFEHLRRNSKVIQNLWHVVAPRERWEPCKGKDIPPTWRRVALGDETIVFPEQLPKFRGRDPFEFDASTAENVVGFTLVRDGRIAKEKLEDVVRKG